MGKTSFACGLTMFALVGCAGSDARVVNPYVEDGSVARASIESEGCGSRATLIELPEHCRWPDEARSSAVLSTSANVVVDVDADGKPRSARVVDSNLSVAELGGAVAECAMHGRYRAAWNGAGETCPVKIRLARYPSDVVARP
jgi:hypothetical protein